jgi:hypothetical protein
MMRTTSLLLKCTLGLLLLGTTFISCKKGDHLDSEVGGGEKGTATFGNIAIFASASASGIKATSSTKVVGTLQSDTAVNTVAVNWYYASIWVEKISFVGKNGQSLDTTIMVGKKLDIFNAEALMGVVKLPPGAYKDINVKMFCRKSPKSEFGFDFSGTFMNTQGRKDSVRVGTSYPFEADLKVNDIVLNPADNYKATFHFDLTKVLTGISNSALETRVNPRIEDSRNLYRIWKGGSKDEPFYDEIIKNWQNVASIVVTKDPNPIWK